MINAEKIKRGGLSYCLFEAARSDDSSKDAAGFDIALKKIAEAKRGKVEEG